MSDTPNQGKSLALSRATQTPLRVLSGRTGPVNRVASAPSQPRTATSFAWLVCVHHGDGGCNYRRLASDCSTHKMNEWDSLRALATIETPPFFSRAQRPSDAPRPSGTVKDGPSSGHKGSLGGHGGPPASSCSGHAFLPLPRGPDPKRAGPGPMDSTARSPSPPWGAAFNSAQ